MKRERLLPLVDVGSVNFEHICDDLIESAFPEVVSHSLKRVSGTAQFGVDVEGFDRRHEPVAVISAKCYRDIQAWYFREWVDDFLKHLDGHWRERNIKHFVLAVTHPSNDDEMNDAARTLVREMEERGIQFHYWNAIRISEMLRQTPHLVDRYFGKYWVEALSAAVTTMPSADAAMLPPASNLSGAMQAIQQAVQMAEAVIPRLNQVQSRQLEVAIGELKAGRPGNLIRWVSEVRADRENWDRLDPDTRAKALRTLAMTCLDGERLEEAETLLDEADAVHAAPDASARALLLRARGNASHAMVLLAVPRSTREREIKAGLLIESGRPSEALALLADVTGESVTSETLRVRAIARFLTNDRPAAIRDAISAVSRGPLEAAPSLTLGIMRVLTCLVDKARPQFGFKPNPITPGLLRDGEEVVVALNLAIGEFDRLSMSSEGAYKEAAESWKLAGLLLHSSRRDEAALFAQVLMRRAMPDPVVAAWLFRFDLLRAQGRLRKKYGDAIRAGRGSAEQLIVLAQLSAGPRRPDRGLRLLERYGHLFPRERDLIDVWRVQFGGTGDVEGASYAAAVHRVLRDGDAEPLTDFLLTDQASTEELLLGAEFLASRSAWKHVERLHAKLAAVGNEHAAYLAAQACLRGQDPEVCLDVLREVEARSRGRLPRRFVYLRIRANEALGRHRPIIDDLLAIKREGDDPYVSGRLIHAYAKVGALPELKAETETALAADRLDPKQALQVAHVLRVHAPETARRALEVAARGGLEPEMAGAVVSLAAQLGLAALQNEYMRLLIAPEREGQGFIKFDDVQEMLQFMGKFQGQYQANFTEWLHGRMPAALALHSDIATYARLFLASPGERKNEVGDLFPMLLRSGAAKPPADDLPVDRPVLRLDLSALLLAERLDILDLVEQAFDPQVPDALMHAVLELEAKFQPVSSEFLSACRAPLLPGGTSIRIGDIPAGAFRLESEDEPHVLDRSRTASLLRQAYLDGHIDGTSLRDARARWGEPAERLERIEAVALSPATFPALVRENLFDVVSRSASTYLTFSDADRCRRMIDSAEHDRAMSARITKVRETVSRGLTTDRWRTFPATLVEGEDERHMEPHLRCLMDILAAATQDHAAFWIEDRPLFHGKIDCRQDILDVLRHLRRGDFIDGAQHGALIRRLHGFGYSFLMPDADHVEALIEDAPLDAGRVVESPALAGLRIWLAEETDRVRYLALAPPSETPGPVVGETRHLIELDAFARRALSGLWARVGPSAEEKIARSEWVWTCLRLGRSPVQSAEVTPEVLRQYLGMTHAHALDVPLFAALGHDAIAVDVRRAFVEWFVETKIVPLIRADPELLEVVAGTLALLVALLLEPRPDLTEGQPPNVAEALDLYSVGLAKDFLDLLPKWLADRVAALRDIGAAIRKHTTRVLNLSDDGPTISFQKLAEAFDGLEPANGSGQTSTVQVAFKSGVPGRFEVEMSTPPKGTLVVDERRYVLPEHAMALLGGNVDARVSGLRIAEGMAAPGATIRPNDLDAAARLENVADRFEAFGALVERDFVVILTEFRDRLGDRGPINPEDLKLPSAVTVSTYVGLTHLTTRTGLPDGDAEADLIETLGAEVACGRLAALPTDHAPETLSRIGDHFRARIAAGDEIADDSETPLRLALKLRAIMTTEGAPEPLDSVASTLARSLDHSAELFAAFVRLATLRALDEPDWCTLDVRTRTGLLWVYADAMADVVAAMGMDVERFATWVRGLAQGDLSVGVALSRLPSWGNRITAELSGDLAKAVIVSSLFREGGPELSPEAMTALKDACGHQGAAGLTPPLQAVSPAPPAPSEFWAARDPLSTWVRLRWTSPEHPFAARNVSQIVRTLLAFELSPENTSTVTLALAALNLDTVDQGLLPAIREYLERGAQDWALGPEDPQTHQVLSLRARVLAKLNDEFAMRTLLRGEAVRCSARWPNERIGYGSADRDKDWAFQFLMGTALRFSRTLDSIDPERMETFASLASDVADAWPEALRGVIAYLDAMTRAVPAQTADRIWPTLLSLRSRA